MYIISFKNKNLFIFITIAIWSESNIHAADNYLSEHDTSTQSSGSQINKYLKRIDKIVQKYDTNQLNTYEAPLFLYFFNKLSAIKQSLEPNSPDLFELTESLKFYEPYKQLFEQNADSPDLINNIGNHLEQLEDLYQAPETLNNAMQKSQFKSYFESLKDLISNLILGSRYKTDLQELLKTYEPIYNQIVQPLRNTRSGSSSSAPENTDITEELEPIKPSLTLMPVSYSPAPSTSSSRSPSPKGLPKITPATLTLDTWCQAFDNLPKNREGAQSKKHSGFAIFGNKAQQWDSFESILKEWLNMMINGPLENPDLWSQANTRDRIPNESFFNIKQSVFMPYAQKLIATPDTSFYVHGDLHGDIFSLLAELKELQAKGVIDNNFNIIKRNTYFLFLGDYVDRGQYGCEVLYTIMRLALANPDHVICVRGNHEDAPMNWQETTGFKYEVNNKFKDPSGLKHRTISRMYGLLPVVLYIGCEDKSQKITNFIQCCHGGIETGYDPSPFLDNHDTQYQLIGYLDHNDTIKNLKELGQQTNYYNNDIYEDDMNDLIFDPTYQPMPPSNPAELGFLWNDFSIYNNDQFAPNPTRGVGFMHGELATMDILNIQSSASSQIRGIIRAHQHSQDTMHHIIASKGVFKLWRDYETDSLRHLYDGLVWTFNVGADSIYGEHFKFDFDTYAKITLKPDYQNWTMEVFNTQIM